MTKSRMVSYEGSRPVLVTFEAWTHVGFEARTQSRPLLAPQNDDHNTMIREKVLLPGISQRVRGSRHRGLNSLLLVESPLNSLRSILASSRFEVRPVPSLL